MLVYSIVDSGVTITYILDVEFGINNVQFDYLITSVKFLCNYVYTEI